MQNNLYFIENVIVTKNKQVLHANKQVLSKDKENQINSKMIMIPQGYKDSPLGIIPNDWKVKSFKHIIQKTRLGGNYENSETHSGIPLIKMGNIGRGSININKMQYIPKNTLYDQDDVLKHGDLLFNTRNTLELVGKVAIWRDELPFAIYNSNLLRMKFNPHYVSTNFFVNYLFNYYLILSQLRGRATGTTSVAAIYSRDLNTIKLLLPPLPEQQAIADILSTWDNAIEKYEALLEQYELRKKGLMQRLLSGKRKNWKEVKLKNLCTISKGQQLNKIELESVGEYPSYSGGISPSGFTDKWNTNKDTIIISEGGNSCGYVNFITTNFWCGGHCYALLELKNKIVRDFLFHNLKYNESKIMRLRVGSGLPNIQKKDIESFKLLIPSLDEQNRIANILQTADKEIALLKDKIEQLRGQKKGLMQVLLTGRKRVGADLRVCPE